MDFKTEMKNARIQLGITQKELAESIGVKQKDISRWENGEILPNLNNFAEICKALKLSADKILGIEL